ncbi:MAG: Origin recognition complex subunit 2 [Claussenomyces sp. TS43310]|nr:MAG: Origin recognition complex subunit 2 [Claussenomyces sp. TS43310]
MKRKNTNDEESPSIKRARWQSAEDLDEEEDILHSAYGVAISPRRRNVIGANEESEDVTPVKRGRGRPKGSKNTPKKDRQQNSTPRKVLDGKKLFSTPIKKANGTAHNDGTPSIPRNADRSARRKSARTIIERTMGDLTSEDEDDEDLARHIYDNDEHGDADEGDIAESEQELDSVANTPSKKKRGRPKGSKNTKRSPTPTQDLPPHELYFAQHKEAGSKTSNNNLSSLALLDYEEYFNLNRQYQDPHAGDIEFLQTLHSRSFNQWQFELSQDFNICIYGWGSKRALLTSFATYLYNHQPDHELFRIVVVNGYIRNTSIRDILSTVACAVSSHPQKLGSQPAEMLESLCALLEADKDKRITVIINSIDAVALRRAASQNLIARLASHPQISLVASADHPNFPLLWDSSLRSTYNFAFHDCTTFQPYAAEMDVVDDVHSLLGRGSRRVGGKEGVSFVLKSLPMKAKELFRVLVAEQLAGMDVDGGLGLASNNHDDEYGETQRQTGSRSKSGDAGVEYHVLYQKAAEDFICPNEMTFRTLLKEFYDHQMIESRKDAAGTEMLSVPFRKEELEMILEDLMS